jgi:peptide chain release factor 3
MHKACWIESDNHRSLDEFKKRKHQKMAKDKLGRNVFMADSAFILQMAQDEFKDIRFHFTSEF